MCVIKNNPKTGTQNNQFPCTYLTLDFYNCVCPTKTAFKTCFLGTFVNKICAI